MNVSDFLVRRLAECGVRLVYGYPGDGINGVLGALNREGHGLRFIQARHEEMAAFMAVGHAKFTGEVGVCLATSGPGAIHLLNGLYDAKMDRVPVVAIVGQSATTAMGGDYQQEVDLPSLFKDVAHEYVQTVMSPASMRHVVDRAVRIARAERTVTCVILPKDVQEMDAVEAPPHEHDTVHTSVGFSTPRVLPNDADLARAAEILNAGERVAMLVGAGRGRRGGRRRRGARGGRREGAPGHGGAARVAALRHGFHRHPGHAPELGDDARVRHAPRRGVELPLRRVPPEGGPGARRPDRPRRPQGGPSLPGGARPRGRREGDAARPAAAARAEGRPRVARQAGRRARRVGRPFARARPPRREPRQPDARVLGAVAAPARRLHHRGRLGPT